MGFKFSDNSCDKSKVIEICLSLYKFCKIWENYRDLSFTYSKMAKIIWINLPLCFDITK